MSRSSSYPTDLPEPYNHLNDDELNSRLPLGIWADLNLSVHISCLHCGVILAESAFFLLRHPQITPEMTTSQLNGKQFFRCERCNHRETNSRIGRNTAPTFPSEEAIERYDNKHKLNQKRA